jgi:hypothetical protein
MQINQRLYPHPVLSWFSDDYPKGIFQPALQVLPNKSFFRLVLVCKTSSKAIKGLIAEKKAAYCIHVECPSTRYRSAFISYDESFEVDIPVSDLEGKVEVSRTVVCTLRVKNFSCEEFHSDFAGRSFDLAPGDVVAVAETVDFPAIKKEDELAKTPSIFSILRSQDEVNPEDIDIDLGDQKLKILLSPDLHKKFLDLNADVAMRATLCSSLLIPALICALEHIRYTDEASALLDRRWFNVLSKRMGDIGIDAQNLKDCAESSLVIAYKLLGKPLAKSFDDLESLLVEFGDE